MSSIGICMTNITNLDTDAIVNAANEGLWAGGGVCGAGFDAAGYAELQAACDAIGHCDTGSAVITPGFRLKAKYIIHAVGPCWKDGTHNEPEQLYGAYMRSLELARENGCHSIGFPLLSAGIFGYPADQAWKEAIRACQDFQNAHPETKMQIIFAVIDEKIRAMGQKTLDELVSPDVPEDKGPLYNAVFFHLPGEAYGYLSNWYPSVFVLDGITFSCSEQYIMYRKCKLFGDESAAAAVLATDDPAKQQEIGRGASGFVSKIWDGMKQTIAFRGLFAKFSQNESLKKQLLDTGDVFLVECAQSDKIWACGIRLQDNERFDMNKWKGQNLLGFTLMEVRKALQTSTVF